MSEASDPFDLKSLVRANIRSLKPYSSARCEFDGTADVFLDANENAFGSPAGDGYNRYPDPLQTDLKARAAVLLRVPPSQIFVGNGSDEAIDLMFRIFCEPRADEAIICPPTYGMYKVSAEINDVAVKVVSLNEDFQLDVPAILDAITPRTKLIFVCSPNNPTGNLMDEDAILKIAHSFRGMVVIDEAYINFAHQPSMVKKLHALPNIVVLQTFSKAWGMAGLRVGLAIANERVVSLMNRVKPPYNVSGVAQRLVLEALEKCGLIDEWIAEMWKERDRLVKELGALDVVRKIYPTDANFVLVKFSDSNAIYGHLVDRRIVVRDRSAVELCDGCLRITVGTRIENDRLIRALSGFEKEMVANL
ncbi:MAG: histidinol-phosphate transaminase [Acidobacteriota bacterium]